MNWPPAWFERKFEFTFPVEQYPSLCARLRGTPARLEEVFRGVPREVAIQRVGEKWSAQEHAGHLADLEALWLARVDDYAAGASELTVADLTNRATWEAKHNDRSIDEILAAFRGARSALVKRAEAMDPAVFARGILHPRLRMPMRLVDHFFFVAEHDDHHLAHVWGLINFGVR